MRSYFVVIMCSIAIGLWLVHSFAHFQRKLPQGDEFEFLLSAEALHATGVTSFAVDPLSPLNLGNWHPPLWWVVMQVIMHTGAGALESVLILNVLAGFATIASTYWLGRCLAPTESSADPFEIGALGVLFLCAMPLFQVASGIIDIDNGLLTMMMTFYVAALVGTERLSGKLRSLFLGMVLGATFLTKISTPLVLIPTTYIYFVGRERGFKEAARLSSTVLLTGALVFTLSYLVLQPLLGRDWYGPFAHNLSHVVWKSSGYTWDKWVNRARTIAELSILIGPPALIFLIWSGKRVCSGGWRTGNMKLTPAACLWVYVISIWSVYGYLGVTFNLRYMVPSLPVLGVLVALLLSEQRFVQIGSEGTSSRLVAFGGFVLLLGATLILLPDPYLYLKTRVKYDFWGALLSYGVSAVAVSFGTYVLLLWLCSKGLELRSVGLSWLVSIWLVFNINTSIKQIAGRYQLSYNYGFREYEDVARWLKLHARSGTPIFASESFVWLFRETGYAVYVDRRSNGLEEAKRVVKGGSFYYQVLPLRYARGEEASRIESIIAASEELYRNRDFIVVKRNL